MKTHQSPHVLPQHPFWVFSCQIYEQAKLSLLTLQHRHNLNINMILFCGWMAASDQGMLTKQEIRKILSAIHLWHERIVLPLRQLRMRIKNSALTCVDESLPSQTLNTELTAEHIEQLMMVNQLSPRTVRHRKNDRHRALQTCQNIENYRQIVYVYLDEKDCVCLSELLTALYPKLGINQALHVCETIFMNKKKNKIIDMQKQLTLDLC